MPSREKKPSKKVARKTLVEPKAIQAIVAVEPAATDAAVEPVAHPGRRTG
jgi:hypothetical protein